MKLNAYIIPEHMSLAAMGIFYCQIEEWHRDSTSTVNNSIHNDADKNLIGYPQLLFNCCYLGI